MFDKAPPRVLSIDSGTPFVDALAAHLLDLADGNPMALAEMRILLPTRRACRSLTDAFLRLGGGAAHLLPRLTPLGDIDEDALAISETGAELGAESADNVETAISGTHRQLLLARAVMALPSHGGQSRVQPEQAVSLALELARLIDRLATEDRDPAALKDLAPEEFAAHWQEVLRFLSILADTWPDILAEEGVIDPARRRNIMLRAQARLWRNAPPATPVIAAGSTGSISATTELLSVIAGLPKGAVVLPGLDRDMNEDAWSRLEPTHPQYGLKQLLGRLELSRTDVRPWPGPTADKRAHARTRILSAALLPAEADADVPDAESVKLALDGVRRLDCPGPSEEAAAIALIMRYTLETPAGTCALVTPDRSLARRVAAALKRWDIHVDDSAGTPLAATPPGALLRLIADAARQELAPVPVLALLKHPLVSGGLATQDFRRMARALEIAALRGPRPGPGVTGLRTALGNTTEAKSILPLLKIIDAAIAPLAEMMKRDADYRELLRVHVTAAETLAANNEQAGRARLWAGDDGEAAARFVSEFADSIQALGALPGSAYAGVFEKLMSGRAVRPKFGAHPRLFVWGLLEARLQHADTVILGGLNEGTWPPTPETNPWMSRAMMADIGLEPPERRIGLTAHDFQQAFAAPAVILSRADRVAGAPTVPSRWLLRLDNLLQRAGAADALRPRDDTSWLKWAEVLDRPSHDRHAPPARPRPCPPIEARPRRLSVTQVETLIRDPYAIYARKILKLDPLDPIDADPGAAERGTIIHDALNRFVMQYRDALPPDARRRLLDIGRDAFAGHLARPGVRAFWWPRFERIATWFLDWQRARLAEGWQVCFAEEFGAYAIDAVEGGFEIFAKPDRIDYRPGIGLSIIDYKTGQTPSAKQVASGLNPQLPLEAIIARDGQFKGVPAEPTVQLMYVRLSGGRNPGEEKLLDIDIPDVIEKTLSGVNRLVVAFADPTRPFLSRPRPQFENRFGDYDHLARVGEWGVAGGDDE